MSTDAQEHIALAKATAAQVAMHAQSHAQQSQQWCAEQLSAAQTLRAELEQSTSAASVAHAAQVAQMSEQLQVVQSRLLELEAAKALSAVQESEARLSELQARVSKEEHAHRQLAMEVAPLSDHGDTDIDLMLFTALNDIGHTVWSHHL